MAAPIAIKQTMQRALIATVLCAGACTLARAEDESAPPATTTAPVPPAASIATPAPAAPVTTPAPAARPATPASAASPPSQNPPPLSVAGLSVLADGAAKKQSLNFQM